MSPSNRLHRPTPIPPSRYNVSAGIDTRGVMSHDGGPYGTPTATERGGSYVTSRRPWPPSSSPPYPHPSERKGSYPPARYTERYPPTQEERLSGRPSIDHTPRGPTRGESLYASPSPPHGYFHRSVSNVGSPPPSPPRRVYSREESLHPSRNSESYNYPRPDVLSPDRMPHHAHSNVTLGPPLVMRRRIPVGEEREAMGFPPQHLPQRMRYSEGVGGAEWAEVHSRGRGYPPHYDEAYEDAVSAREYYESGGANNAVIGVNRISPSYSFPPGRPGKDLRMVPSHGSARNLPLHPFARAELNNSIPPHHQLDSDGSSRIPSDSNPSSQSASPHAYEETRQDTNSNTISNGLSGNESDKDKKQEEPIGCTCKKSKCLKLYCQCFAASIMCEEHCRCLNCKNTPKYPRERTDAIRSILARNPSAFDTKFQTSKSVKAHKLGCKCRKSACLKKYCECYHAGVKCNDACRCVGCKNRSDDESDGLDPTSAPMRESMAVASSSNISSAEIVTDSNNAVLDDPKKVVTPARPSVEKAGIISPTSRDNDKMIKTETTTDYHIKKKSSVPTDSNIADNMMDAAQNLASLRNLSAMKPSTNTVNETVNVRSSSSASSSCNEIVNLVSSGSDISKDGPQSVDSAQSRKVEANTSVLDSNNKLGNIDDTSGASVLLMAAYAMTELHGSTDKSNSNNSTSNLTAKREETGAGAIDPHSDRTRRSQPLKKRKAFGMKRFTSETSTGGVDNEAFACGPSENSNKNTMTLLQDSSKRIKVEDRFDENKQLQSYSSSHTTYTNKSIQLLSQVISHEGFEEKGTIMPLHSITPVHITGKNIVTPQRIKDSVCEELKMELETEHDEKVAEKTREKEDQSHRTVVEHLVAQAS